MNQTATDVEKELTALEDQRLEAAIQNNLPRLEELLADDLNFIHTSGAVDTKEIFLGKLKDENLKYLKFTLHDRKFKALSHTGAMFSGRVEIELISAGVAKEFNNVFIDLWAKRGGKWQMVSWQSTPISAAAK
jgi:hypothetical protein